jgi:N-acetylglucosamine-6-phosphate deacetylase
MMRGEQMADARDLVVRGRLVSGATRLDDGVVQVRDGRIVSVGPAEDQPGPPPSLGLVVPGLVDVHCHGGAGQGFPEADEAGASLAAAHHRAHGTTSLLASLVSAAPSSLLRQIEVLTPLVDRAEILGLHLEGPFLAEARCGAQNPAAIIPGDTALLERLLDAADGRIRSMTLAVETAQAAELARLLHEHGAVASFGHTDAPYGLTRDLLATTPGRISATHLFNGMPPVHHRAPGPVPAFLAAALRGEITVELIADGVHLSDDMVEHVFGLVGADHIALVSDAMAATGLGDGGYSLGGLPVDVRDGVARLASGERAGSIAGSTARLHDVLRRAVLHAGVDLAAAVVAATRTPARLLGLEGEIGDLGVGARADLLVLDPDDLTVRGVLSGGSWVVDPGPE